MSNETKMTVADLVRLVQEMNAAVDAALEPYRPALAAINAQLAELVAWSKSDEARELVARWQRIAATLQELESRGRIYLPDR